MLYDNRAKRLSPDCDQLSEFAFDVHPICYKQYGVCHLPFKDKLSVFNVVRLVHLVTRRSIAQVDNVLLACLDGWLSSEESASYNQIFKKTKNQNEETKKLALQFFEKAPTESKISRKQFFQRLLPELMFKSSSHVATAASKNYLRSFQSDGRLSDSARSQAADGCMKLFGSEGSNLGSCSPNLARQFAPLQKSEPTIHYSDELTQEDLKSIAAKLGMTTKQ
jgi:hypothetical protein